MDKTLCGIDCGADVEALLASDPKEWYAISMPTGGVRFDARMLELMDTDRDGRIRVPEVLGAIRFLKDRGVDLDRLFRNSDDDRAALSDVMRRQGDLASEKPSEEELRALADWEAKGRESAVAAIGDATADAEQALAAVEKTVDAFFTPPEDLPLVTDAPDVELPLADHLNPRHLEAIVAFAEKCVTPILGARTALTRLEWKRLKAAFAPYRAWRDSKPVVNAGARDALVAEERTLRYVLGLAEFLDNFVTMRRLYATDSLAFFQTGTLRIDAKELDLCFHVDDEAAHAALVGKSNCCVVYARLSRPSEGAVRTVAAVVTAGTVAGLYVGRNGVFFDRDGRDWEATVTRVVESQVSLGEAFWAPWRKLGEFIGSLAKKFLGERQGAAAAALKTGVGNAQAGGAAIASSVAAIGVGVGMLGAALASLMAVIRGMDALHFAIALVSVIGVVSLPSVILTWFKLRRRDLGAILNACGWAVNRPMRLSVRRARLFTRSARDTAARRVVLWLLALSLAALAAGLWFCR